VEADEASEAVASGDCTGRSWHRPTVALGSGGVGPPAMVAGSRVAGD
jgi:hypothetical protein